MFGIVGSVLVILQMAFIANGVSVHAAMLVGLVAAICWIFHAGKERSRSIVCQCRGWRVCVCWVNALNSRFCQQKQRLTQPPAAARNPLILLSFFLEKKF